VARPAVRRIPPPRTLTIESLAELQAFRQSLVRRWRLPRWRVALRIPRLGSAHGDEFERRMNRWLDFNGGWAALVTAIAVTGLAIGLPVPPAGIESLAALSAWSAQVALGWIVGWFAGRGCALGIARWKLVRLCQQVKALVNAL
jgi:hypothetical protein